MIDIDYASAAVVHTWTWKHQSWHREDQLKTFRNHHSMVTRNKTQGWLVSCAASPTYTLELFHTWFSQVLRRSSSSLCTRWKSILSKLPRVKSVSFCKNQPKHMHFLTVISLLSFLFHFYSSKFEKALNSLSLFINKCSQEDSLYSGNLDKKNFFLLI